MVKLSHQQAKDLGYGRHIQLEGSLSFAAFCENTFLGIIEPAKQGYYKSTKLRANITHLID